MLIDFFVGIFFVLLILSAFGIATFLSLPRSPLWIERDLEEECEKAGIDFWQDWENRN